MLENVSWGFDKTVYDNINEFNDAITKWNKGLKEDGLETEWNPSDQIIDHPRIYVTYSFIVDTTYVPLASETVIKSQKSKRLNDNSEVKTFRAELSADNDNNFSALELMFKLHQLFINKPNETNYIEGFDFYDDGPDGTSTYLLSTGT